jgi:GTPase Era involved in 16S rRNA processing
MHRPAYDPPLFNHDVEEAVAASLKEASQRRDPTIAVIGERGVGKSSLINSLRGLRPGDFGAARVGADEVVTSDQMGAGAYYRDAGLIYQDIPGCRGNQVDVDMSCEYIKRYELDKADCCLFVYVAVVNVDAISCARLLQEKGVPVYFVRNKIDGDCANEVEDGNEVDAEAAMVSIRHRAHEQMRAKDCLDFADDDHIFLVSAKYSNAVQCSPPKFDFERLKKALQTSIRYEMRRAQVGDIFTKNAKGLASKRADECRGLVSDYIIASAASGAIPVPGVSQVGDIAILARASEVFQRIFCLTEAQLPGGALAGFGTYLTLKVTTSVPAIFGAAQLANWAADGIAWVPVAGIPFSMVLGSCVSAIGMWLTLSAVISRLEEVAAAAYEVFMNAKLDNLDENHRCLKSLVDSLFPVVETEESLNQSLQTHQSGLES